MDWEGSSSLLLEIESHIVSLLICMRKLKPLVHKGTIGVNYWRIFLQRNKDKVQTKSGKNMIAIMQTWNNHITSYMIHNIYEYQTIQYGRYFLLKGF